MRQSMADALVQVGERVNENIRRVRVTYNSTRSDEDQTVEGIIKEIVFHRNGTQRLVFERDDGQTMVCKEDGKIYSPGSYHPLTGGIEEVELVE